MDNIKDKIRRICTYHGDEGTSGYELTEEQFQRIFALLDQQKQELLDALTIDKRPTPSLKSDMTPWEDKGWNTACDELEARKQKISTPPEAEAKDE